MVKIPIVINYPLLSGNRSLYEILYKSLVSIVNPTNSQNCNDPWKNIDETLATTYNRSMIVASFFEKDNVKWQAWLKECFLLSLLNYFD